MKKFIALLDLFAVGFLLSILSSLAHADIAPQCNYAIPGPGTVNFDSDVPVGSLLWATNYTVAVVNSGQCGLSLLRVFTFEFTLPSLGGKLHDTGIPGVGIRMTFTGGADWTHLPCNPGEWWPTSCSHVMPEGMPTAHGIRIELIKTGEIGTGGTLQGMFARYSAFGVMGGRILATYNWSAPIIIKPSKPTCTVINPTVSVFLGRTPRNEFNGVGTFSMSKPFSIDLRCSEGDAESTFSVYTTLTDQTDSGNLTNALTLTNDSTASGVKIQVLNGSTVLGYGPDSKVIGNPNQWSAGTTGNGVFIIPLSARYIQTDESIISGSANGRATFTMSYQ
ncbi:fimbrial protein [Pseudomonas fragi]|uniref:fimbrial protein n=1 Tax=Pseudomonas fragi TaxID=296 RepID=UPI0021BDF846|nr:fimbrial protein [Pseudomonas fragi]UXL37063.1 fimbrial protein [Pseudomonas fragi]